MPSLRIPQPEAESSENCSEPGENLLFGKDPAQQYAVPSARSAQQLPLEQSSFSKPVISVLSEACAK